jgi:hypothetical protein
MTSMKFLLLIAALASPAIAEETDEQIRARADQAFAVVEQQVREAGVKCFGPGYEYEINFDDFIAFKASERGKAPECLDYVNAVDSHIELHMSP